MTQTHQQDVRAILAQFSDSRADNEMPLGINIIEQMRGKNGGFPRFMYHRTEAPQQVTNRSQQEQLAKMGYVVYYVRHDFPCTLYRRNMETLKQRIGESKEFEDVPKFPDFVETISAKSQEHMETLMTNRVPAKCSAWVQNCAELPEVDNGPTEDPQAVIAQLRGQLEAMQASAGITVPMPVGAMSKEERRKR